MVPNRLALGAAAIACIAAAGVGGYIASRQDAVPAPAAAASAAPVSGNEAVPQAVQETEAVVAEAPRSAARTPAAGVPRPPSDRVEAARAPSSQPPAPRPAPAPRQPAPRQPAPVVERAEPSAAPPRASGGPTVEIDPPAEKAPAASAIEERQALEAAPPASAPAGNVVEEVVVAANAVIGLQTENRISSETARVEDRVEARVTRDVKVGDIVAIPAGSKALGSVIQVERGGKFKERARLGIRFTTLVLADGTQVPIGTDTIFRQGDAPGNSSAAKIGGGAVGGAILGAILGGAKGAAIGATAGAGGGAAIVQAGDRSEVTLPAGSPLTVRLVSPLTLTIEK